MTKKRPLKSKIDPCQSPLTHHWCLKISKEKMMVLLAMGEVQQWLPDITWKALPKDLIQASILGFILEDSIRIEYKPRMRKNTKQPDRAKFNIRVLFGVADRTEDNSSWSGKCFLVIAGKEPMISDPAMRTNLGLPELPEVTPNFKGNTTLEWLLNFLNLEVR